MLTTRKFGEDEMGRSERLGVSPGKLWSTPAAKPAANPARFLASIDTEGLEVRAVAEAASGAEASESAVEPLPAAHLSASTVAVTRRGCGRAGTGGHREALRSRYSRSGRLSVSLAARW